LSRDFVARSSPQSAVCSGPVAGGEGTLSATAAGLATGTLFNYLDSKEHIVAELIAGALSTAEMEIHRREGEIL